MDLRKLSKVSILVLLLTTLLSPVMTMARPWLDPTHTIAAARELANGTTGVTLRGTIGAPLNITAYNELYMQDATAGIDIYGVSPVGLQLGDVIEVTGSMAEYRGKKEITPGDVANVVLIDRGVPPTPVVTQTAYLTESLESEVVVLTGTVSGYTGGTDSNFSLDDGSGTGTIYRDSDSGIDLTWMQDGDTVTVVGIGAQYDSTAPYDSGYQLIPRYQYDIAKGEVTPIALARPLSTGTIVTVQGAVTALPGTFETEAQNRELYVQDGTGGIDVFNYDGLPIISGTLALGDIITVTGALDFYRGKVELIPTAVVTQGFNTPIDPKIQFAGNIDEDTEGLLVVVTGTVSSKLSYSFYLTDTTGSVQVYIDGDTGIDLSGFADGDLVRVIGLSSQYDSSAPYDSGYQITPRVQSDIASATPVVPPTIVSTEPATDATAVNPYLPVKAVFDMAMDDTTIDDTTFLLEDPSGAIAGSVYYDSGRMAAVFVPDDALAANTVHTATVKAAVENATGAPMGTDYVWTFTTTAVTLQPYLGSIHNHTSYSDGSSTPDDAFTSARDRGLDFMAVTDHSHYIDDTEWEDTMAQAISHTINGTYVALAGAEYTQGTEGHLNVYNVIRRPVRTDRGYSYADYTPYLSDFYAWIAEHPEAIGMFNHPGWMNFNDWEYYPETEADMQLVEVGNGAYSYYVWTEEEYRKALDYGWYVGPTNNGDTHNTEWAIDNPGRTGIWASELTQNGVLEALDAMRVFATEDGNFEISLKGDGAWMGETIPNDGAIDFVVYTNDPDNESIVKLELYTDQGQVIDSVVPTTNPYTWNVSKTITTGIHYFFVRAEQADGDRTVSAPIWTEGDVDVSPTALEITPAQLTTLGPANFSVRVTNRGAADATNVTVAVKVGSTVVGSEVITVPTGGDAFATIGWTPNITGVVSIAAEISNTPTGDNPDDNTITEDRNIVDTEVPLIVIDNGHSNNVFVSGDGEDFEDDLVAHGFNWIEDTDGITAADLNSAVLLIISDPGDKGQDLYSEAEEQVIANYVNAGGALLVAGESDYSSDGNNTELNSILSKITGSSIRVNSDGTYDDTDSASVGPWNVMWHSFPGVDSTGIGVNVDLVVGFSGASIYGVNGTGTAIPLTTGNGVTVTVVGDDDTYQNDGDLAADHFVYTGTGVLIPMAAVQELPGGGRLAVWGDSDESFSDSYTYVPGDGYQNEIYNMETIYWLLGRPLEKWDIATARADAELNDTPDYMNNLVWIEGTVTAAYANFYDVMYIQDDTGGVTIYAPVTGLTDTLTLGKEVRVVGRVQIYQNDTEIQIDWDPEQVQIIGEGTVPAPLYFPTGEVGLEENEGWLVKTIGCVTEVLSDYSFMLDNGSGEARAFIDGYNGDFTDVEVGDCVGVTGLASEDGDGSRIRVRSESDIMDLLKLFFPLIFRS